MATNFTYTPQKLNIFGKISEWYRTTVPWEYQEAIKQAPIALAAPLSAGSTILQTTASIAKSAVGASIAKIGLVKTALLGTGAAVAAGTLTSSPTAAKKTVETISRLPQDANPIKLGQSIGNFIENPSAATAKKIITDNPIIAGAIVATGAVVGGKAIIGAASGAYQTNIQKQQLAEFSKQTKLMEEQAVIPAAGLVAAPSQGSLISPIADSSTEPLAQQTKEIEKLGSRQVAKKAKKRRKIYKVQPIRQSVRILNVNNSAVY